MTNYNVEEKDLRGERDITGEHVQNNSLCAGYAWDSVVFQPENLPPAEDIKKLERRVKISGKENWRHSLASCRIARRAVDGL